MNPFSLLPQLSEFEKDEVLRDISEYPGHDALPEMYKLLVSTFDLSVFASDKLLNFYSAEYDAYLQMYEMDYMPDENVAIEHWIPLDKSRQFMKSVYNEYYESMVDEYVAIAEGFDQSIILIGTSIENRGEIFVESVLLEPRIKKIASNLLEFLLNFKVELDSDCLPSGIRSENLYKNWGEDFWRIRKDGDA
ncbi:MAG: hypothetical protein AB8F78_19515 [Saprospiraceae bacterium]